MCDAHATEWLAPANVRAICFDAGDTLIFDDPSRYERAAQALSILGISYRESELAPILREVDVYAVRRYAVEAANDDADMFRDCVELLLSSLGLECGGDAIRRVSVAYSSITPTRRLLPGAVELLKALRLRGFKIGIVSDWEADLPSVFDSLGCTNLINAFAISDVVGVHKPAPALFQDALDQLKVTANEVIHVGDYYELDVEGARCVGMHPILFDLKGLYEGVALDVPVVASFSNLANLLNSLCVP
jgi:putative hydrolase of the HAD superfamily